MLCCSFCSIFAYTHSKVWWILQYLWYSHLLNKTPFLHIFPLFFPVYQRFSTSIPVIIWAWICCWYSFISYAIAFGWPLVSEITFFERSVTFVGLSLHFLFGRLLACMTDWLFDSCCMCLCVFVNISSLSFFLSFFLSFSYHFWFIHLCSPPLPISSPFILGSFESITWQQKAKYEIGHLCCDSRVSHACTACILHHITNIRVSIVSSPF